jgi:hypothetical protein
LEIPIAVTQVGGQWGELARQSVRILETSDNRIGKSRHVFPPSELWQIRSFFQSPAQPGLDESSIQAWTKFPSCVLSSNFKPIFTSATASYKSVELPNGQHNHRLGHPRHHQQSMRQLQPIQAGCYQAPLLQVLHQPFPVLRQALARIPLAPQRNLFPLLVHFVLRYSL